MVQKGLKFFLSQLGNYGGGAGKSNLFRTAAAILRGQVFTLMLSIPWLPTSLNKSLRTNRFAYQKKNKAWDCYISAETHGRRPPQPILLARISLIRHSHRTLDFDGLVGSMKPVVDALVTCRILKDDSWAVLGAWSVDQRFRPKKDGPLLEITVEEIKAR